MSTTNTTASAPAVVKDKAFSNTRAALLIQEHAIRIGLPLPHIVAIDSFDVRFHVRALADLAEWAKWMETTIKAGSYGNSIHHECEGLALEHPIQVVYIEAVAQ